MELTLIFILIGFGFAFLIGKKFISIFSKREVKQVVSEYTPENHQKKTGTLTMGGLIFILPITFLILLRFLLIEGSANYGSILFLFVFLAYALLGFLDDFLKVIRKHNDGLSARQKILGQIFIFIIVVVTLVNNSFDTTIFFPLLNITFDFGIFYYAILFFMLVGGTNATNLTDGVDGLLTSNAIISFFLFAIVFLLADYSGLYYLSIFAIGSLFGFLYYNFHPAKVFMGDTGSMAIGAALAMLAILGKVEMLFVWFGLIYIIEVLSVILQIASIKLRNKKILLMSPLHHHFEKLNWSENKIVITFTAFTLIFGVIGILVYLR